MIFSPFSGATNKITEALIDAAGGVPAFLTARFNDDIRANRWFFTPELTDVENNVTDAVTATAGSGAMAIVKRESIMQDYSILGAGYCELKALNGMHNEQGRYGILGITSNDVLEGQVYIDPAVPNAPSVAGEKVQLIDVPMLDEPTYADPSRAHMRINRLRPKQAQLNVAAINLEGLGMDQLFEDAGVATVVLQLDAAPTVTGVFSFYANAFCGQNLGLAANYGAALTAGVFKAINGTTGATLAITSIAVNQTTGLITITLTTPPASTTPVLISMQLPSVVFGILGARFEVVKPLRVLNF